MSSHFMGVDAGGTQTRALLATEAGEIIGVGYAAGANSWSSGTSVSKVITSAMRAAIDESDPASVAGGVIAAAGAGSTASDIAAEISDGWRSLGLAGSPHLVPDFLVAYAAGTAAPLGMVLASGTGSIAAVISGGELERRSGGHGWMVGDEGSAVWLGIKGVGAALRALDGRGPDTILAKTIPGALDIDDPDALSITLRVVAATYGRPPAHMGRLAPLVIDACERGDPVAQELVEVAAGELTDLAAAVLGEDQPPVIVLAGSLLIHAAPIRDLVRARLGELWPSAPIVEIASGEAGAVALAITQHTGAPTTDAILAQLREVGPHGQVV